MASLNSNTPRLPVTPSTTSNRAKPLVCQEAEIPSSFRDSSSPNGNGQATSSQMQPSESKPFSQHKQLAGMS